MILINAKIILQLGEYVSSSGSHKSAFLPL